MDSDRKRQMFRFIRLRADKPKRTHNLLKSTVLWLFCSLAMAENKPALPWILVDAPPLGISEGELAGRGIHDDLLRIYRQKLPEYRHVFTYASITRLHAMLADPNKNFCVPAMFKLPQQEKTRSYASFNQLSTPISIMTVRDNAARIGAPGPVSLRALLNNSALRFGLAKSRSYGSLDPLIAQAKQRKHVKTHALQNHKTLYRMLLRGRIDYTLGLSYEAGYIGRKLSADDEFISVPIKETPDYELTYPNCTGNDWGKAVVAKLNDINTGHDIHLQSIASISYWSDPATARRLETAHRQKYRNTHGRELPARTP